MGTALSSRVTHSSFFCRWQALLVTEPLPGFTEAVQVVPSNLMELTFKGEVRPRPIPAHALYRRRTESQGGRNLPTVIQWICICRKGNDGSELVEMSSKKWVTTYTLTVLCLFSLSVLTINQTFKKLLFSLYKSNRNTNEWNKKFT